MSGPSRHLVVLVIVIIINGRCCSNGKIDLKAIYDSNDNVYISQHHWKKLLKQLPCRGGRSERLAKHKSHSHSLRINVSITID